VWGAVASLTLAGAAACGGGGGGGGSNASARHDSTAAGKERAPAIADREARPARVLFVGTSLTAGLGIDPSEAFPAVLAAKADSAGYAVEVVNAGVSGETSAGALRRIDWLLRSPVDVFVLETGANDGLRGLDVDSTRANIEQIVKKVKGARPEAQILLVQMEAPPNMGSRYTTEFRAMFPAVASAEGVTLAPFLLEGVAGKAELNQGDGIHPSVEGARRVADNLWPSLRRALDQVRGGTRA
jgi:acyl-CoA thioesterase I